MDKEPEKTVSISAVIPAHNNAAHIRRSVDSVLAQTLLPDEIIVVDDGSTDDTAAILAEYGEKIRYIHQANAGASAARNTGIQAAKGHWIAFLDADDEWLPHHLQTITDLLKRNPHLVWATANYITCSCSENRQAPYVLPDVARRYLGGSEVAENYFNAYLKGLTGHTDTMVIQKTILMDSGLFHVGQKKANDLDMWWRIAYRHPQIGFVVDSTAIYHLAVENSISKKLTSWHHYAELIRRHRKYASESNQQAIFDPFIAALLRGWLRGMLFDAQKEDIRRLMSEFKVLLPGKYRALMWILTVFPRCTQAGCRFLSKIIRTLRLRRRVVIPPAKSK